MIKDKPKLDFRYLLTKLIVITYSKHPNHRSLKLEFDREAHSRTIGTRESRGRELWPPPDFGRSVNTVSYWKEGGADCAPSLHRIFGSSYGPV